MDEWLKAIKGESRTRETVDREVRPREANAPIRWTQDYTPFNSPLEQVIMYIWNDPSIVAREA